MIDLMTLKPGDRLLLTKSIVAEVTANMGDGMWVEVRLIEAPTGLPKLARWNCVTRRISSRCWARRRGANAAVRPSAERLQPDVSFLGERQDLTTLAKLLRSFAGNPVAP